MFGGEGFLSIYLSIYQRMGVCRCHSAWPRLRIKHVYSTKLAPLLGHS